MPATDWSANTQSCFPTWGVVVSGNATYVGDVTMNKFRVVSIEQQDLVGGSPSVWTTYAYIGAPAWHYTDDPIITRLYYNEPRGFESVFVTAGNGSTVTKTLHRFYRGMYYDELPGGLHRDNVSTTVACGGRGC